MSEVVLAADDQRPLKGWERAENMVSVVLLSVMVVLPVIAVFLRWFTGTSFGSAGPWVRELNLWLAFFGGALAARAGRHLSLSTGTIFKIQGSRKDLLDGFTTAVGTAVTAVLAYASVLLVISESGSATGLAGGVPYWLLHTIMPAGFAVIALRLAWYGNRTWSGRGLALLAVALAAALALVPPEHRDIVVYGGSALIVGSVALGAPLFTAMGGIALLLFFGVDIPVSAVPSETVRIVADPALPSLPLFTLAGYLLAEGGSSKRLVRLFRVLLGWMPGGVAAAAIIASAFFTTFTGASGVTILALGGLLLPALESAGYSRKYAIGLLVASGSIGLLFPPSLPVILYGVASNTPITDLFLGGLVPGFVFVGLLLTMAVVQALRNPKPEVAAVPRDEWLREAGKALWDAKFILLLPVLVLVGIFGGLVQTFEAAAMTAAYAFLLEVVIHRDLSITEDIPRVFTETATLMGGVLIILGVALGFTSYLVDAEVPMIVSHWVEANIGNRLLFILLLNVLLLIVGSLMDIYSAIMVVVPLITPIAAVFGIHPVHLGILFLANLELGYLTPPVGINLFLASFRFKMDLTAVYRLVLPFLGVMALGVVIIAYVPALTVWGLEPVRADDGPDFFEEAEQMDLPLGEDVDMDALLGDLDDMDLEEPAEPQGLQDLQRDVEGGGLDMDALLDDVEVDE